MKQQQSGKTIIHAVMRQVLARALDNRFGPHWVQYLLQSLCAAGSVFVVLAALRQQNLLVAASLAATAFTIFMMPGSVTASTRNVIGGHLVGLAFGSVCMLATPDALLVQDVLYALTVGGAMLVMVITNTEHPPAAGTALGVAMAPGAVWRLSLGILLGVLVLALIHRALRPFLRDLIAPPEQAGTSGRHALRNAKRASMQHYAAVAFMRFRSVYSRLRAWARRGWRALPGSGEHRKLAGGLLLVLLGWGLLVTMHAGGPERDAVPEPGVFYSDWVRDPGTLPPWDAVAGTETAVIYWLKQVFEREGVPPELIWMAAVESGFDPLARSQKGAAGLFQLMPETARRYGLASRDRYDPLQNTEVAARFLGDLYRQFGDWAFVLAAFNAGQNRVARLCRIQGTHYAAVAPFLPAETRSYVTRVRALISYREKKQLADIRAPFRRRRGILVVADNVDP